MKFLERLSLNLFSAVVLLLSAIIIMMVGSFLKPDFLTIQMQTLLANPVACKIAVGVSVVFILLALKNLLFGKNENKEGKDGILLENGNGKLLISRESLENIVNNVTKNFEGTENVSSKMTLDKDKNLRIYVITDVNQNIVIKELSNEIQTVVKDAIKKSIDLEVKEVNIKIRNINAKKSIKPTQKEFTEVKEEVVNDEKAKVAKSFLREYAGAIIGGLIAIVLALTGLYKLIVTIILVVIGVFVGNYVQRNKVEVKEKLKSFIDKL